MIWMIFTLILINLHLTWCKKAEVFNLILSFNRWGRSVVLHLTNFIYVIFTVGAHFVAKNYYWYMALIGIGSTFPSLGIRIAFTLGEFWNFFNVMASGGLYSIIYITIHSLYNYLCVLDTTLRVQITWYKLHVKKLYRVHERMIKRFSIFTISAPVNTWDHIHVPRGIQTWDLWNQLTMFEHCWCLSPLSLPGWIKNC